MARQPVVEVACARCPRKEYVPWEPDDTSEDEKKPDLVIELEGERFQFDELCTKCMKTVRNYVSCATKNVKENRKVGAKRGAKKRKGENTPSS